MSPPSRIARRCLNCGASESSAIPLIVRRFEGLVVFVCQDTAACAKRFQATQDEQPTLDWRALEFKAGF